MELVPRFSANAVAVAVVVAVAVAAACGTPSGAQGGPDAARGQKFFQLKCNRCHPDGGAGVGPAIDPTRASSVLTLGTTYNRHTVPQDEYAGLLEFLTVTYGPATAVALAPTPTEAVVVPPVIAGPIATAPVAPPVVAVAPVPPPAAPVVDAPPADVVKPPVALSPTPTAPVATVAPTTSATAAPTTPTAIPTTPAAAVPATTATAVPTTPAPAAPTLPTPPQAPAATPREEATPLAAGPPSPGSAVGRIKVIVLDLKGTSIDAAATSAVGSLVTVTLSEFSALEVVSGSDVREMMALEGAKELTGCEGGTSCVAELAGALGARVVVYGQIEKLGSNLVMSLNLQDTLVGKSVGRMAFQADDIDALGAAVPGAVQKMVAPFLEQEHLSPATTTTTAPVEAPKQNGVLAANAVVTSDPEPAGALGAIALSAGGGVLVVGGVIVAAIAAVPWLALQGQNDQLKALRADFDDADATEDRADISSSASALQAEANQNLNSWNDGGQYFFVTGVVAAGVGLGAAAVGIPWLVMGE